jgi:hypothetical protein
MTAAQIAVILRKAGYTKASYAPGQRVRFRQSAGYTCRKVDDAVRVDYMPDSEQQRSNHEAAQQATTVALASYRQSIKAAGYAVETVTTLVSKYLRVTKKQQGTDA